MSLRYAKLIYAYKCAPSLLTQNKKLMGNIGDAIQTIAIENIYAKLGVDDPDFVSLVKSPEMIVRDELPHYSGPPCILPMQAWFGEKQGLFHLPWPDTVRPVFIGFHLSEAKKTRNRFVSEGIHEKMKKYRPIGCRDRNTMHFLRGLGIEAYFSACMTLTFDKRGHEPKEDKIFVVDLAPDAVNCLPETIKKHACFDISHSHMFSGADVTLQEAIQFEDKARRILDIYRDEAKMVITSRIHVAMPCMAMGIPVIFINRHPNIARFDVLQGLIPVYSINEMPYIDWEPKPVDIDLLKATILDNAKRQLRWAITNTEGADRMEINALNGCTAKMNPIFSCPAMERRRRRRDTIARFVPLKPVRKWLKRY